MSSQEVEVNPPPTRTFISSLITGLALAGLGINGLLVSRHRSGDHIAGCGADSSCEEVLASRWSELLGIPVAMLGLLLYLVLLTALSRKSLLVSSVCLGLIIGAAAWFVFVQAVIIGSFCSWCMVGHGIGVAIVGLSLWREKMRGNATWVIKVTSSFAAMTSGAIGVIQIASPLPVTHKMDEVGRVRDSPLAGIHARGEGRKAEFDNGRIVYNVGMLPHMGQPNAKHVLVEYFDYQCTSCRIMSGYLSTLIDKHPEDVCVILLPVPLEHGCNSKLSSNDKPHIGSCELTRIALAVWRVNPDFYPAFHQKLLSKAPPTPSEAMAIARDHVSAIQLESAMSDPWLDELIQANIRDWVSFSAQNNHLPKLLVTGTRILHGLPSGEADFIRVMEQELEIRK